MSKSRFAAFVVTVAALGVGVAYASIPGPNGVISACYDNQSGQTRIVDRQTDVPKGCGSRESLISWNQTGPQGLQGNQGLQGDPGVKGDQGLQGDPGPSGGGILYSSFLSTPLTVPDRSQTSAFSVNVLSLSVPAGAYLITYASQATQSAADCRVGSGNLFKAVQDTTVGESVFDTTAIFLPAGGSINLRCTVWDYPYTVSKAKLFAVQAGSLSQQ